jgi:hypothetical protein
MAGPTRVDSQDIRDLTIVDGDVAAANKDGTAGTPSLRTLGAGAQQAAAGDHSHSDVDTGPTLVFDERPVGAIDGSNAAFVLANTPAAGTLRVYKDGMRQRPSAHSDSLELDVNSGAGTFTRDAGSFIVDGFQVGDVVTFSGFGDAGNNATKTISVLTALVMTVSDATGLVDDTSEDADDSVDCLYDYTLAVATITFETGNKPQTGAQVICDYQF